MALNSHTNHYVKSSKEHHNNTAGQTPNQKLLSAREKKILASVESVPHHERNGSNNGLWRESEDEWIAPPSNEILNLKQSINFECSSIPINFTEAWSFFQSCDMSQYYDRIEPVTLTAHSGKLRTTISEYIGQPALNPSLMNERKLILSVAACPMNNDCIVHRRILQSIYVFMTKNPSCSRYGGHWEDVGFQGQDPASDLRGVGMFGALQMLYLSSSAETKETLAPAVFTLSRHPIHQFPLAVLSLNVTKMALDAFRDELLNKFCNKENSAITVVNKFYLAIMYRIFTKWSEKGMTIHDSCFLLKSVEKWCRANPKKTFMKMNEYLDRNGKNIALVSSKKKKQKKKSNGVNGRSNLNLSFLDLTKPSVEVFI